ncbi:hypothetical protein BOTNAR_0176g00010 [Botryotinia narcissicola]|uniref:Uncharacterized protein n=1 Tax=Botryotinia narcissicola TaxID=278944 RepID=A0A4Z1IHQ7_9HELO|nr:hypothetical protein BOTNAR_0176g00010 [Botryotinia narcissicola]
MSSAASGTNSRISRAGSKIKAIHTYSFPEKSGSRIERTESHKPTIAGSSHSRIEQAESDRAIEIPELETQDLDRGGRDSPQPSLSPGDTVEPSAARKKFGKNNEGRDSEAEDRDSHRSRRRQSYRKEEPIEIDVRIKDIGPSTDEIVTTTLTTFHGLPFSLKKKTVQTTQFKRSLHEGEDHKKPSGSDRIPRETVRGLGQNRKEGGSDRNTRNSSPRGSVSSREKSKRKPKSATSSINDAPSHRSARDLQNKYQPIRGPTSIHEQEELTQIGYGRNDKNNEPYALEIGKHDHKSSGSIHSKASTPTPPESAHSKVSTPTPPESAHSKVSTPTPSGSIHSKVSTPTPPESAHSKVSTPTPSGSIHSKASTRTSSGSIRSKVSTPTPPESTQSKVSSIPPPPEDERTQIFRGKVAEKDNSSAYTIEKYLSNLSASGSDKSGGRRASTRNSIALSHYAASEQASSSHGGGSELSRGRRAHR